MRKLLFVIFILLTPYTAMSQVGVNFEHLTFNEALIKAKESNKMVFVDCYTSWCGPCKKLASDVFPQKEVGDYINERFISVKYDVEQEENKFIAKDFKINAYPTLLIVSPDGKLIDKIIGYHTAEKLIESIEYSFDRSKSLSGLKEKYQSNDKDKQALLDYYNKLIISKSDEAASIGEKLYESLTDEEKKSEQFWSFYSDEKITFYNSARFKYLTNNYNTFCNNIGKDKVDKILIREWLKFLKTGISFKSSISKNDLNNIKKEYRLLGFGKEHKLNSVYKLALACNNKDIPEIIKVYKRYFSANDKNIMYWAPVTDIITKSGTSKDKIRWIEVSEKLKSIAIEDYMRVAISYVIDEFKK